MGILAQAAAGESSWFGGASEKNPLALLLAQQNIDQPIRPQPEGYSPWGFVKNLVGDVPQFVGGLSALGSAVIGDVVKAASPVLEKMPGVGDIDTKEYVTDDIVKGLLPGMLDYAKEAYGSGLGALGKHLYEDPLFAAMDVSGVGQAIGGLKAGAAKSAMRTPEVASQLSELGGIERALFEARKAGQDLTALTARADELTAGLSPQAAKVRKTLPGAARNLADPDRMYPLGGEKFQFVGRGGDQASLVEKQGRVPLPANPYKRWQHEQVGKLLSHPMEKYLPQYSEMLAKGMHALNPLSGGSDEAAKALFSGSDTINRMAEVGLRYGIDRIDRPLVADLKLNRFVNRLYGDFGASLYRHRDRVKLETERLHLDNPYIKAVAAAPGGKQAVKQLLDNLHVRYQVMTGMRFAEDTTIADDLVGLQRRLEGEEVVELQQKLGFGGIDEEVGAVIAPDWADLDSPIFARQLQAKGLNQAQVNGHVLSYVDDMGTPKQLLVLPKEAVPFAKSFAKLADNSRLDELTRIANAAIKHAEELELELGGTQVVAGGGARATAQEVRLAHGVKTLRKREDVTPEVIRESAEDLLAYIDREYKAKQFIKEDLVDSLEAARQDARGAVQGERYLDKLHADIRWLVHKEMVEPSIERGFIKDYQTVMNRQVLPVKLERFDEAIRSPGYRERIDELGAQLRQAEMLGDTQAAQAARRHALIERFTRKWKYDLADTESIIEDVDLAFDIMDEYRQAGLQAPVYFPHIDPNQIKRSDWTAKRASWGMGNLAGTGSVQKNTGLLYLDNMRYIKDPIEAYARRASLVIRMNETYDFIDTVTQTMARPIHDMHDYDPNVELVWAPYGGKRLYKLETEMMDGAFEAFQRAMDMSDDAAIAPFNFRNIIDNPEMANKAAEVMKKTFDDADDLEFFQNSVMNYMDSIGLLDDEARAALGPARSDHQLYAIPKVAADRLNGFSTSRGGPNLRMFWDGPTNFWRTMVLTFTPRWMFNNFLGNIVFAKLQGAKLRDALAHALDKDFYAFVEKAGAGLPERARATMGGLFTETTETALGEAEKTLMGQYMRKAKESGAGSRIRKMSSWMRNFNSHIEEHFRAASYVHALERQAAERGMKSSVFLFKRSYDDLQTLAKYGADEAIANKALDSVNYFFNDYSRLSPTERNVVRRYIMPFYSFYKHIVTLAATYPLVDPARAALVAQWGGVAEELEPELGMVPEWMRSSNPIGSLGGTPLLLGTRGANPFDMLQDPLSSVVGYANPLARGFLSYVTGRRLDRTGQPQYSTLPIGEGGDVYKGFGQDQAYRYDETTGQLVPTTVRPGLGQILSENIPQFDIARDLYDATLGEGLGTRYDTGEVRMEEGAPSTPKPFSLELAKLLGLSLTPYDLEEYQEYRQDDLYRGMLEVMKSQGRLPEEEPAASSGWFGGSGGWYGQ